MSYADAAKKGPAQRPEDKIPDAVPEIAHSDSGVHSLDSLSPSNSNPQYLSYADQQKLHEEAEAAAQSASKTADQASKEARDFMQRAEDSAKKTQAQAGKKYQAFMKESGKDWDKLSKDAQKKYQEFSKEAGEEWDEVVAQGKQAGKKLQKEGKEAEQWAEKNKGNPVVVGNLVVVAALGAILGTGAYRMQKAGTLTWNVAGAWAGAVGLFAVGDYFVSQWLFKNKYPPKN